MDGLYETLNEWFEERLEEGAFGEKQISKYLERTIIFCTTHLSVFFYIERVDIIKDMIKKNNYKTVIGGRKRLSKMYQIPRINFKQTRKHHFMDYLDDDTKSQWWWEWYQYKYGG